MPRSRYRLPRLSRRELLQSGALGIGLAALRPPKLWAAQTPTITRLLLRYRTDPERIARALPPPLQPDDEAEVWVEYALAALPDSAQATLITPLSIAWSGIFVTARHEAEHGLFPVGLWTSDEWGRINAREFLGLNAKSGEVSLEVEGKTVRATVRRYEEVLHRLETKLEEQAAAEPPAEDKRAIFLYRYRLDPNWKQGPLGDKPVELLHLRTRENGETAAESSQPSPSPLACVLDETVFQWQQASPSDPAVEFPVEEILAVTFERGAATQALLVNPRDEAAPQRVAEVAAKDFEPWALLNYDRPVTAQQPWRPKGWRESATAFRLSAEELKTYREREELRLTPVDFVDIQLVTEREAFLSALPPQFQPGLRLRLLALRVDGSDLTPAPFNEVWLLAYGLLENEPVWYALSHIVGPGGDLLFGRETFGYPSKRGELDVVTTPVDFNVLGRRKGREFFYTEGRFQTFSTGTSLAEIDVACLRAGPFDANEPRGESRGEFVVQRWYFQGQRSVVDRESFVVEFPDEEARGGIGRPDPWFEFKPFRMVSVTVMQHGGMQRMPAEIVAQASDIASYYTERCDGVLAGKDPVADFVQPTFRVKPAVTTRSALPFLRG